MPLRLVAGRRITAYQILPPGHEPWSLGCGPTILTKQNEADLEHFRVVEICVSLHESCSSLLTSRCSALGCFVQRSSLRMRSAFNV